MTNKLLAGTLALSTMVNVSLISDMNRIDKKTDEILNTMNRANLIATLYVLKNHQNTLKHYKEETKMKKLYISNRTKVFGTMTILLGAGTAVSAIKDLKAIKELDATTAPEVLEEITEDLAEAVEDAASGIDDIIE